MKQSSHRLDVRLQRADVSKKDAAKASPRKIAVGLVALACFGLAGITQAAEIKVLSAGALGGIVKSLAGEFERSSGHTFVVDTATAGAVAKRVAGGEAADVIITTTPQMGNLVKQNKVVAASSAQLAKVGVGIMVKAGAKAPRLASEEDFKKALLSASAIVYTDPATGGASGIHIAKVLKTLGIAEQVSSKTVLVKGGEAVKATAQRGNAAIGMTQISEIVGQDGVELVGPLPEKLQGYTVFSVGVAAGSKRMEAANALVRFLKGSSATAAMKAKGMQPG